MAAAAPVAHQTLLVTPATSFLMASTVSLFSFALASMALRWWATVRAARMRSQRACALLDARCEAALSKPRVRLWRELSHDEPRGLGSHCTIPCV